MKFFDRRLGQSINVGLLLMKNLLELLAKDVFILYRLSAEASPGTKFHTKFFGFKRPLKLAQQSYDPKVFGSRTTTLLN